MRIEAPNIDRRTFFKGATAILCTGAVSLAALRLSSEGVDDIYKKSKDGVQPRLKNQSDTSSMFLGVYPHGNNPANVHHLNDFGIVGYFGPWYDWTAKNAIYTHGAEQIPMISTGPYHAHAPKRPFRYRDLVEQKVHIKKQAQSLTGFPTCLFRYGFEMNADWFPHGSDAQSPQEFIDGWKLVTEIVKEVNPNILTVWAPNVDYPIVPYYPDEDGFKPDIMALDGYNKRHLNLLHARHLQPNPSFTQLFAKDIVTLQELDTEKPILISEIGIDYGNSPRARTASLQWMADALSHAATYERVMGVCVFAWNKSRGHFDIHEGDWGNILTDEFHTVVQENSFYVSSGQLI